MEQTNQMQSQTTNQKQGCCSGGKPWLMVLVIVVAFIAGGIVYALQQETINSILKDLQTQITNLQNQVMKKDVPATDNKTNPATDETANWKIYTNPVYKYTVNYPASWFVDDKNVDSVHLGSLENVNVVGNDGPITKDGSYFLIRAFDLTIPKYKESWPAGIYKISDLKEGLISMMPPFRPDTDIVHHIAQNVYFTNGNFGYIFQFGSGSEEQDQKDYPIFAEIIKSFKFTK